MMASEEVEHPRTSYNGASNCRVAVGVCPEAVPYKAAQQGAAVQRNAVWRSFVPKWYTTLTLRRGGHISYITQKRTRQFRHGIDTCGEY